MGHVHVPRGGIISEWWGIEWLGAQPGVISGHHKVTMSSEAVDLLLLTFSFVMGDNNSTQLTDLSLVTNSGIVSMEPSAVPHMEHVFCKLQLMLLWVFSL